jgi:hypothetical protein
MSDQLEGEDDFVEVTDRFVRAKIMHVFSVFGPRLSPSMVQVGIGTAIAPRIWHPVLETLLKEGSLRSSTIARKNPATNRDQTYTVICIPQ